MAITVDIVTAPSVWACYLINGDASGLDELDIAACDAWRKSIAPAYVVSVEGEPRFTRHFRIYGGDAEGGDVVDYITHVTE